MSQPTLTAPISHKSTVVGARADRQHFVAVADLGDKQADTWSIHPVNVITGAEAKVVSAPAAWFDCHGLTSPMPVPSISSLAFSMP